MNVRELHMVLTKKQCLKVLWMWKMERWK